MPKDGYFEGLSEDELVDTFCQIFDANFDSKYSADIICCDNCYDDFIDKWPEVAIRELNFTSKSISLSELYESLEMNYFFSENTYNKLMKNIECPRCASLAYEYVWPFVFPFDTNENIEEELGEIYRLSIKTPFLLLKNSFAKEVYDAIHEIAKETRVSNIIESTYRAREKDSEKKLEEKDFYFPPSEKTKEGRYNHAGKPVLYLGDSKETCAYELDKQMNELSFAKIDIIKPIKILDFIEIKDDWSSILNILIWSSLMSSPTKEEGWDKKEYIFTRFVADCAVDAGFDAIKYPSVRYGRGYNIVILKERMRDLIRVFPL